MDNLLEHIEKRALLAFQLAEESAKIAMDFLGKARQWDKEDSSPVTEADLAIDNQLQEGIRAAFPDDAILSEEGADDKERLEKDICWIIDPIDGTKEFIRQSNDFCVMIGICYKGAPVYGVIHIPQTGEVFYGGPEFGASLKVNNKEVALPHKENLNETVLMSLSKRGQIVLPYLEENNLTALRCGSSGVKACRLIDGTAQHYIHGTTICEWDTAAADALVRGAGAFFRGMDGDEFT
jgi:3'(2'), 5'-bisphosphate nucleotidase